MHVCLVHGPFEGTTCPHWNYERPYSSTCLTEPQRPEFMLLRDRLRPAVEERVRRAVLEERERCAADAFEAVKAIEESPYQYSTLQKAAQVAAYVRRPRVPEPPKRSHMNYCGLDPNHDGDCAAVITRSFGITLKEPADELVETEVQDVEGIEGGV